MKIEEKVPTTTPKSITSAKGRTTVPPSTERAMRLPSAVEPVKTVRGKVSLIDRLRIETNPSFWCSFRFSRTRSKMMIVSLSE